MFILSFKQIHVLPIHAIMVVLAKWILCDQPFASAQLDSLEIYAKTLRFPTHNARMIFAKTMAHVNHSNPQTALFKNIANVMQTIMVDTANST